MCDESGYIVYWAEENEKYRIVEKNIVSFDAGGGTGTMEDEEAAEQYTLPECTFTAPEGMRFKTWEIDGFQYEPGESIYVLSGAELTAVWEEIPLEAMWGMSAETLTQKGDIEDAVLSVEKGEAKYIRLIANIDRDLVLSGNDAVAVIDLNGYTISSDGYTLYVDSGADITLVNTGDTTGKIICTETGCSPILVWDAFLTIENDDIYMSSKYYVVINECSEGSESSVIINGGCFYSVVGWVLNNTGTMIINDCDFISDDPQIEFDIVGGKLDFSNFAEPEKLKDYFLCVGGEKEFIVGEDVILPSGYSVYSEYGDVLETMLHAGGRICKNHEHTYVNKSYVYDDFGHALCCDICKVLKTDAAFEVHEFDDNMECFCGCKIDIEKRVYIADKEIKDGEYCTETLNIVTEKPTTGGYAYYKDGVLVLHNFNLEMTGEYTSLIDTTTDLIILLEGDNRLSTDYYVISTYYGDVLFTGKGTLEIRGDVGVFAEGGDVSVESGTIDIFSEDDGVYIFVGDFVMYGGTLSVNECGDDGIDVSDGNVFIEGGILNINSDDHGMDVDMINAEYEIIVYGGTVQLVCGDEGIETDTDVIIESGVVDIVAEDIGIDSEKSVIINGGTVSIEAHDTEGIQAVKEVVITDGTVTVTGGLVGIYCEGEYEFDENGDLKEITDGHIRLLGGNIKIAGVEVVAVSAFGDIQVSCVMEVIAPDNAYVKEQEEYGYICKTFVVEKEGQEQVVLAFELKENSDLKHTDETPLDHVCDVCGLTFEAHTYDEGKITTKPGCEKTGVKTFTCICGETYTEIVEKTGHLDKNNDNKCDICEKAMSEESDVPGGDTMNGGVSEEETTGSEEESESESKNESDDDTLKDTPGTGDDVSRQMLFVMILVLTSAVSVKMSSMKKCK